jgi:hypothetical protein
VDTDIGVVVGVGTLAMLAELWTVDAAVPQPAAVPMMRDAPITVRATLRPPFPNRMPILICRHPSIAFRKRLSDRKESDRQFATC